MKILVTGAAGFIGFHLTKKLVLDKHQVVALDNLNDYYEVNLKTARLAQLGIDAKVGFDNNTHIESASFGNLLRFVKMDIQDRVLLPELFKTEKFDVVCNLAAQAGVRYSLENPEAYIDSNIVGFLNILECAKSYDIRHLVYASSSSVYGNNKKMPFSTGDSTDEPISLYAASKKSNELLAYTYSHLYGLTTTGLRFFTVYGPWGRPDMAIYKFTEAILKEEPIHVFNKGKMARDFTFIDDIVEGIHRILEAPENQLHKYKLYNIGNNRAIQLLDFILEIEKNLGKKAITKLMPLQPGDVQTTWADTSGLKRDFDYSPNTTLDIGVKKFVEWFKSYKKESKP